MGGLVPFDGRRGFDTVPTGHLADSLRRYKRLRDGARDEATRSYAASCVREIRDELAARRRRRALTTAA